MADNTRNGGGLFATARKLAKVAVKKAIERLTGMPLSGDPWGGRPRLDAPKAGPIGFPTVVAPLAAPVQMEAPLAPLPPPPPVPRPPAKPVVAKAPVSKPKIVEPPPLPKPVPEPRVVKAPPPDEPVEVPEPHGLLDFEETPESYGQDDVGLLLRDPGTIFLWWEVTPAAWDRARAALGGDGRLFARLIVRWRDEAGHYHEFVQDHHLDWDHGRRYLPAPARDAHVSAHIGLIRDGHFAVMISAPSITVPPTSVSSREADDWMFVEPAGPPGLLSGMSARRAAAPIVRARGSARVVAQATGAATLGHAAAGQPAAGEVPALPHATFQPGGVTALGSSLSFATSPGGVPSSSFTIASSWSGSPTRP